MPPQKTKPKTSTKTHTNPQPPARVHAGDEAGAAAPPRRRAVQAAPADVAPEPAARPGAKAPRAGTAQPIGEPAPPAGDAAPAIATATAQAPEPPRPRLVPPPPEGLSEPWMAIWAEAAAHTGDAEAACAEAGVTFAEYVAARRRDPVFDGLCRVNDQVVDLRITDSLRSNAMRGDVRHQSLYFARVRDLLLGTPEDHSADALISSTMAEAMIRAGLVVGAAGFPRPALPAPTPSSAPRPSPSPSRPGRSASRNSEPEEI